MTRDEALEELTDLLNGKINYSITGPEEERVHTFPERVDELFRVIVLEMPLEDEVQNE